MATTLFTNAVTLSDAAWFNDVDSNIYALTAVSGADTITATGPNSLTAYATGKGIKFIAAGTNTGAVTINVSSLGAKAITKNGATALVAGDIPAGMFVHATYDGTRFVLDYAVSAAGAAASQAQMEAASDNTVFASPSNLKWFPAIPKVYCVVDQSSGTAALSGMNFGVSSVSDGATGVFTINFNTNFSATTYGFQGNSSSNGNAGIYTTTRNVGSVVVFVENIATGTGRDLDNNVIAIWGDQ